MEKCERETIIRINDADLAEGYFVIGTSVKSVADKLQRRFHSHVRATRVSHDKQGKETYWQLEINRDALPDSPFMFKKRTLAGLSGFQKKKTGVTLAPTNLEG